jgi:hypothetical protein
VSDLAPLHGRLLKSTRRYAVDDPDLHGWCRVGAQEYRILGFKQRTPGQWNLRLTLVLSRSEMAAQALEE